MKLINLVEKRFGRLTVIKRVYPNAKNGHLKWLCKCNCGKEIIVTGNSLRRGNTKSCGCLQRDSRRLTLGLSAMRQSIIKYKRHAKEREIDYRLTEEQFKEITQRDCYYCGAKPNNVANDKKCYGSYIYNGIDRVDNNKGYTMNNVVPCCIQCNQAKSKHTLQEFKDWVKKVFYKMKEHYG